jgi:WD40 repeat protein
MIFASDPKIALTDNSTVWDVAAWRQLHKINHQEEYLITIIPLHATILSLGYNENFTLWDMYKGNSVRSFPGPKRRAQLLVASDDGQIAATISDKFIQIWNIKSGLLVHEFTPHKVSVSAVKFSIDGKILLTGGCEDLEQAQCNKSTIKTWDAVKWRE